FAKAVSGNVDTGLISITEIERFPFHIKFEKGFGLGDYRYDFEGSAELVQVSKDPNKINTLHISERNKSGGKKLYRIRWKQSLLFAPDLSNGRLLIAKRPLEEWVKLLPEVPSDKNEKTSPPPTATKQDYISIDSVLQELRRSPISEDDIKNAKSVFHTSKPGQRYAQHFQRFYITRGKPPSCCIGHVSTPKGILEWWKTHLREMDISEQYINDWCSEVKSTQQPVESLWEDIMARRNSIVRCFLQLQLSSSSSSDPIEVSKELYKEMHSQSRKRKRESDDEDYEEDIGDDCGDDTDNSRSSAAAERKHVEWDKINIRHYMDPLCASK